MSNGRQIRCAIYTRKSSEEGLEQEFNSLDAQRESCEAYVASQKPEGWIALHERYDDGGFSGGTLERPALKSLLEDIEAGKVDVVVVYKIDRLTRSLMDFAKLVEVFDRRSATFVSVTQAFNTTTSMGRLTLNVLLSFAQFEREVTGERIRDKFAASKKKGMWMGGRIPLGYDLDNRRLIVNPAEAETVQLIFRCYLDLGCVRALKHDLAARGIASKCWTSSTGVTYGGARFDRGALYCLLRNRLYVGEITHKGEAYPGEQEAIVPRELFDAVQQRLASTRRRQMGKKSTPQDAPLAGILFDEAGSPMTPTYSVKSGQRRYRYYASHSTFRGEETTVSIPRVPAVPLENLFSEVLARLRLPLLIPAARNGDPESSTCVVSRADLRPESISLSLNRDVALSVWRASCHGLNDCELVSLHASGLAKEEAISDHGDRLVLTLPVRARFRGGRTGVIVAPGSAPRSAGPDKSLIKALARAHRWKDMLVFGEVTSIEALARRVGQERRHVGRTLSLAFLSPAITKAIVTGQQPAGLRLSQLLDTDIPLSWRDQQAMVERLVCAAG